MMPFTCDFCRNRANWMGEDKSGVMTIACEEHGGHIETNKKEIKKIKAPVCDWVQDDGLMLEMY